MGNDFRTLIWKLNSTILNIQMDSNVPQDPTALALQIQTLTANVEELTKHNQEEIVVAVRGKSFTNKDRNQQE